ncbi:Ig-like domain-containing protein [Variovorax sp. GT1P44]|uniref:vWA domain-containing protein n=1 Tax=Variovorax sp. GT1P44 TaxID=3443742 RepID=UPI003F44F9F9
MAGFSATESGGGWKNFAPSEPKDVPPPEKSWVSDGIKGTIDDVGAVTGLLAPGGFTDDKRPEFNGVGEPGSTIVIEDNGRPLGPAKVDEDGKWSFIPPSDLDEGHHSLVVKVVDIAGNVGAISDPASLTRESMLSLQANDTVVHEAALNGGTGKDWLAVDGSNTSDRSASGSFNLGATVTGITITLGGQPTGLILADLASGKAVTVGGDTLTIINLGNGQYGYTYTLGAPKSHDTSGGKVGEIVNNDFRITATDGSGKSVSASGEIKVVNDEVTASPGDFIIEMPNVADGVVITLILDHSGSMLAKDGGTTSRWDLAKEATLNLLDKYAESYPDSTSFEINLVVFDGLSGGANYTSIAAAKAAINAVPDPTNGGTNYKAALGDAESLIQASMSKHADHDQKVYFITDGVPSPGYEQPAGWSTFVTANKDLLDVYAVGLGPAVNTPEATEEIMKVLGAGDPTDRFIPVVHAEELSDALMETLPTVDGHLLDATVNGGPAVVALGADGGFTISQVTVGGVDYTFGTEGTVTIQVASGLTMTFDEQGNYKIITSLASPNLKVPMIFTLTDADGDTSVVTEQFHFGGPSLPLSVTADAIGFDTLVMDARDMHIDLSALEPQSIGKFDLPTGGNNVYTNLAGTAGLLVESNFHVVIL